MHPSGLNFIPMLRPNLPFEVRLVRNSRGCVDQGIGFLEAETGLNDRTDVGTIRCFFTT